MTLIPNGTQFGFVTVQGYRKTKRTVQYQCRCVCGIYVEFTSRRLHAAGYRSCGCKFGVRKYTARRNALNLPSKSLHEWTETEIDTLRAYRASNRGIKYISQKMRINRNSVRRKLVELDLMPIYDAPPPKPLDTWPTWLRFEDIKNPNIDKHGRVPLREYHGSLVGNSSQQCAP